MTDSQPKDRLFRPAWGWLGWSLWILAVGLLIEWVFGVGGIGQTARNACSVAFWLLILLLAFDGRRRRKRRSVPLPD
jgi:hypothetical protein